MEKLLQRALVNYKKELEVLSNKEEEQEEIVYELVGDTCNAMPALRNPPAKSQCN